MDMMHKYFVYHGVIRMREKLNRRDEDFKEEISLFSLVKKNLSPEDSHYTIKCSSLDHMVTDLEAPKKRKSNRKILLDLREIEESFGLPRTAYSAKKKRRF